MEGEVTGPIVWDTVQIGNYVIDNQAIGQSVSNILYVLSNFFDLYCSLCNDRQRRTTVVLVQRYPRTRPSSELVHLLPNPVRLIGRSRRGSLLLQLVQHHALSRRPLLTVLLALPRTSGVEQDPLAARNWASPVEYRQRPLPSEVRGIAKRARGRFLLEGEGECGDGVCEWRAETGEADECECEWGAGGTVDGGGGFGDADYFGVAGYCEWDLWRVGDWTWR